ncbi:MAG: hypothetical protein HDT37_06480 [Clostridiales bacterium]|nr:hypothetical protein [Clostridiales bacterium]
MKKLSKILSVGLSLALCANMVAPALAASFTELQNVIDTQTSLKDENDNVRIGYDNGTVTLHEDVKYEEGDGEEFNVHYNHSWDEYKNIKYDDVKTAGVVIGEDKNVTIDLNGHNIDGDGQVGSVIKIDNGGELTLKGNGTVTGAGESGGVYNNGTFTMDGGSIEGNVSNTQYTAAGVTNAGEDAAFTMNGGSIKDNGSTTWHQHVDGGVYNHDGTFTMNNGSIENNRVDNGSSSVGVGGVNNESGTFTMNGGTIANNKGASGGGAGGVENQYGGTFTMTGGTIKHNEFYGVDGAGGVRNWTHSTFNMSGGTIEGNMSSHYGGVRNGSGVGGEKYYGIFHMSGDAKITGNIGFQGGGVASTVNTDKGVFTMSDNASITDNISLLAGGVYTSKVTPMTMTGNAKIEGNISTAGGGVFINNAALEMDGNASIQGNYASLAKLIEALKNAEGLDEHFQNYTYRYWMRDALDVEYKTLDEFVAALEAILEKEGEAGRGGGVYMFDGKNTLTVSGNASIQDNMASDIGDEICALNIGGKPVLNAPEGSEWLRDNPEDRLEDADEVVFTGEELTDAVQAAENNVKHTVLDVGMPGQYAMTGLKFHKGEEPEIPDKPIPAPPETDTTVEIDDVDVPLAGIFTRADAIGYLWERTGSPEWELSDFPDVPEDHYWAVAIGWAQDMGIALPDEDGNFRPDDPVLRSVEDLEIDPEGELQEFLNRYAVFAGIELEDGELFVELAGNPYDIIMREEAEIIFNDFFAKLAAALAQAA